ncbi:MAG: ABC transporter ATP-binding protein [Candidatus Saccharibacteria bacterium]
MIAVKDVTKTYGKGEGLFTALYNINTIIPKGSTTAIIGKSGSGKSTLMHVMSGLDHATSGEVIIDGKSLQGFKPKQMDAFRATQMSFIFQAFFIEANQTCYQNVMLPLEIAKVPDRERRKKVEEALQAVDLLDKMNGLAANLSGGQKQRLAIARAIVNKPKLIFADEPTGNLDSATGDLIISLLFNLNKKLGCTLVIVTHDEELADRCQLKIYMKDGEISKTVGTNKLTAKQKRELTKS